MDIQADWLDLAYKPSLPNNKTMGIGVIGAGEIVEACHLPAYRMGGLNVVGIYDVNRAKAQALAEKFGINKVYSSLEELLNDLDVLVVDMAVPAKVQPDLAEQAVAAGKHILCQKPLAENYADAVRIARASERANVKAAVNRQMRWLPGILEWLA